MDYSPYNQCREYKMRFFTLITSGIKPKAAAKLCAADVFSLCDADPDSEDDSAFMLVVVDFINECFKAIGFMCTLSREEIDTGMELEDWPREWLVYVFRYNSVTFTPIENFLFEFCEEIHKLEYEFLLGHPGAIEPLYPGRTPLEWMIQLLRKWYEVCIFFPQQSELPNGRFFEEPTARINFQLLRGVHNLRKSYRSRLPVLDELYIRLYHTVVPGIYYEQSHYKIVSGILEMIEKDFETFYELKTRVDVRRFYYEALSVENQARTFVLIFKHFQNMLQCFPAAAVITTQSSRLTFYTNFFVEKQMQEIYFTVLKGDKSKRPLTLVLYFLDHLQKSLLSLDCFTNVFIESVLSLVLNNDGRISMFAAKLYIKLMCRKFDEEIVFKHMLEFYLNNKQTPAFVVKYVGALWPHFFYMQSPDVYFEIIRSNNTSNLMRILTSHMLLSAYKLFLLDYKEHLSNRTLKQIDEFFWGYSVLEGSVFKNKYKFVNYNIKTLQCKFIPSIEFTLKTLPELLTEIPLEIKDKVTCNIVFGNLVQIFALSNNIMLAENILSYPRIIENFQATAINAFKSLTELEYPVLMSLFTQLSRCIMVTEQLHLLTEAIASIMRHYTALEEVFAQVEQEGKKPEMSLVYSLRSLLQKMDLILKVDLDIIEPIRFIFEKMKARFIDSKSSNEFYINTNTLTDVYAIEIIVSCLLRMSDPGSSHKIDNQLIAKHVPALEQHILNFLTNTPELLQVPMVRIKAYFVSLIKLCNEYSSPRKPYYLKLTTNKYHLMVRILLLLNFETKVIQKTANCDESTQIHPKRVYEYQQIMFLKFAQLHANEEVQIPTKAVWKLCIHYGLPELEKLLCVLATHRFENLKHILPVVIYNLFKRKPALTDQAVLASIKAYKAFINKKVTGDRNSEILNVHIVLVVLQILAKSLSVLQIEAHNNRLDALRHLNVFIEDLNLSNTNVVPEILTLAKQLQNYLLTVSEQKSLQAYLVFFENYQKDTTPATPLGALRMIRY